MTRSTLPRLLLTALLLLPGMAPAAPLTDFAGNPHSIDDYLGQGRWLVVLFWAHDCPVCNAEVHQYNDFHIFHDDSAAVLGVSIDGPGGLADAKAFVARHQLEFPNLIGSVQTVDALYRKRTGRGFRGTPTILVYDPAGRLVARRVGAIPLETLEQITKR